MANQITALTQMAVRISTWNAVMNMMTTVNNSFVSDEQPCFHLESQVLLHTTVQHAAVSEKEATNHLQRRFINISCIYYAKNLDLSESQN